MKLSAPVYRLKRNARLLSRQENIPLHTALNRIAAGEGFASWSLLSSRISEASPAIRLFPQLAPGDLVLVGARPGHGKTLLSLELAIEAMKSGNPSVFFTLEYTGKDVAGRFRAIGTDITLFDGLFEFDSSDAINAGYIAEKLAHAPRGTLAVIDYLQLLDQKRENPDLMAQVRALKTFAHEKGLILVFISQVDRSFDPAAKPCPDIADIRLPNPLDLQLFSKTCFLHDGEIRFQAVN
jgi:replicative DNA helicase